MLKLGVGRSLSCAGSGHQVGLLRIGPRVMELGAKEKANSVGVILILVSRPWVRRSTIPWCGAGVRAGVWGGCVAGVWGGVRGVRDVWVCGECGCEGARVCGRGWVWGGRGRARGARARGGRESAGARRGRAKVMWRGKCGVASAEWEVWSGRCGVGRVERGQYDTVWLGTAPLHVGDLLSSLLHDGHLWVECVFV